MLRDGVGDASGTLGWLRGRRTRLDDRAGHQRIHRPRSEERRDDVAAGRLPNQRDPCRITAKRGNLAVHPTDGSEGVVQTNVGIGAIEHREAFNADAVVDCDEHHAIAGEGRAVVGIERV